MNPKKWAQQAMIVAHGDQTSKILMLSLLYLKNVAREGAESDDAQKRKPAQYPGESLVIHPKLTKCRTFLSSPAKKKQQQRTFIKSNKVEALQHMQKIEKVSA